jgi:zinc protease
MPNSNRSPAYAPGIRRAAVAALCCLTLAAPAAAGAAVIAPPAADGAVRATLDNGLRVILVRNTLAPVVTTSISYLVGADQTPPGFPGTAHAQEHMMFRGSPGLSADQLANIGSVMGGSFNAQTRQTVTQYYYTVPAEDIDVALHIEALRMRDVLDSAKDWDQERGAIEQEVAQDVSSPQYLMFAKLRQALFADTTYAHDGLGTKDSFDRTTAADLKAFHDRWYAPNNAVLVVAGDFDPAATLAEISTLFGDIPAKPLPARAPLTFRPVAPQALTLPSDLAYGVAAVTLRLPGLDSPDYPALEVLADVLGSERGALYELVPEGKALSASFVFDPLPEAGMAMAAATFPAGGDAAKLEAQLRAVLADIARNGVPADLVAAAKLHERRTAEFEKTSIEGLATTWSEAVAVDGLSSPDEDLARIEKVSNEDVNRVARKYLDLDHAVVAVLTPQGSGKPVAASGFGGQEAIVLGEAKPTPLPDWADAALARLQVPASTVHPIVSRLANGITLIVQPENVGHTVSVFGHIKNRPELEVPKGQDGLAAVLDDLFSYGSENLDRVAFQRQLDLIGADETAGADFHVSVLKENFARGVALLADNELHPALPPSAFDIVRRQVADTVAGRLQSPGYLFGRALRTALLPKGDPALREALPATVSTLTLAQVRDYYDRTFRPDLAVIVVVGDVTPAQAQRVIGRYFGSWRTNGPKPATVLPPVPPNPAKVTAVPDSSRIQDEVTLGETIGITRADPDVYALRLGDNVLGGGFYSTRLSRDLRKEAGLVYAVDSHLDVGKSRGMYFVDYACDPKNVSKVHASIVRELEAMQAAPVGADELLRAKAMLLRQAPLEDSSTDAIGLGLIGRWSLDLPLDEPTRAARRYIALTADDVRAAFVKWIRPADLVQVTRGPLPE